MYVVIPLNGSSVPKGTPPPPANNTKPAPVRATQVTPMTSKAMLALEQPAVDPTPTQYVEKPTLKNAKCVYCHTMMAIAFTRSAPHGGVQCVSRKGCEERKTAYETAQGSANLNAAMKLNRTPKESALAALGQGEAPNGMRITRPTDKELKNAGIEAKETKLVRVTDEDEPDVPTRPEAISATERDRATIYEMEERQGIGFILKEALTAEGFASIPSHLIGIIIESAKDTGEISFEGFTNILAVLAKAAKGTGYHSLAFFMAQAHFNETSKKVSGF